MDARNVPVDFGAVAPVGVFVGLAGREVKAARDFFVEQNVLHRLQDVLNTTCRHVSSHVWLMCFPIRLMFIHWGLDQVLDAEVWNYARDNGFIMVSKDADFSELSLLHDHPPKLIWLRLGNCTTTQIETLLRSNYEAIERMNQDATVGILSLF